MTSHREQRIQGEVQLAASRLGWSVFRNNVGQLLDRRGVPVRYGLMRGSSDLIGWRSLTITTEMVGQRIAQFVSIEVKTPAGRLSADQETWLAAVARAGGLAAVARSPDDLDRL